MSFKVAFVFLVIGLAVPAMCYSSGAPKEACDDMTPQHQTDPQSTQAPYNIQLSRKAIRSGDEITVTITGKTAADTIKGFLVQARQGKSRIGKFEVDPSDPFVQTLDCGDVPASAVTHKKHDDKDDKRSISLKWISPRNYKGEVVFRATIVLNGGTFWVGESSDTAKVH